MSNEILFPCAEQPWVPTLVDVERMKAAEPDDSPVDWRRFGWSALEVPQDATHVIARFDILATRFLERYAYRMLNAETMEKWQVRLQNRFDEVVRLYERAYSLYADNEKAMLADVIPGMRRTSEYADESQGESSQTGESSDSRTTSATGSNKTKNSDTPDSKINSSDNYAGSISIGSDTSESSVAGKTATKNGIIRSDTGKRTGTEVVQQTGGEVIDAVNHSVKSWMDIDTAFIAEFENNFMNVWWY